MKNTLNIGLFGFGVTGESLWNVIQNNASLRAHVKRICIKHPGKARSAPAALFTTEPGHILADEDINVVVELTDDAEAAYDIVSKALKKGKAVVTANKKMLARHLPSLLEIQKETGSPLLYEAACCASIPVIRNLEEYYDNDLLRDISGIVNGSTNYILTRIAEDGLDFASALRLAQAEGFADSDPALDIEGHDACNKLVLLLLHGYGALVSPENILTLGITKLHEQDARYAQEKGYKVKLVANARKLDNGDIAAFVLPQFVSTANRLYHVANEYNGVIVESNLADHQFFNGKGAGGYPTASAIISDLSALKYNYRYEYKKLYQAHGVRLAGDYKLRVYISTPADGAVPADIFDDVEEWGSNNLRTFAVGTVWLSQLRASTLLGDPDCSVIAMPDALVLQATSATQHQASSVF